MRYLFGFICALALGVVGCSETSSCTEAGIRAAIAEGGGPHMFDCDGPTTVVTEAEIVIDNDVILDGEGKLTIDGDGGHGVFSVPEGVTAELRGLTVTGGSTSSDDGGGGIRNEGTLTIRGCVISDNYVEVHTSYLNGGGGISNDGQLTIIDTTIAENYVSHGEGGGIYNWRSGTLTLVKSTVSDNTAAVDNGGPLGGGIRNEGELTIVNSTVSENSIGSCCGGSVYGDQIHSPGRMSLTNSTVSENLQYPPGVPGAAIVASDAEIANTLIDGDCEIDSTVSGGYNIQSPGDTCGFDQPTDQVNVSADDLKLGPLQDNGGPTETHSLGEGSVAIDAIPEVDCVDPDGAPLTTDQRGFTRPVAILGPEPKCDVGAFEVQP